LRTINNAASCKHEIKIHRDGLYAYAPALDGLPKTGVGIDSIRAFIYRARNCE
jgi:hypothetical protein